MPQRTRKSREPRKASVRHSLVPAFLPHHNLQDSLMRLSPGCPFTHHMSISPPVRSLALQTLANTQQDQGQGHGILVA